MQTRWYSSAFKDLNKMEEGGPEIVSCWMCLTERAENCSSARRGAPRMEYRDAAASRMPALTFLLT